MGFLLVLLTVLAGCAGYHFDHEEAKTSLSCISVNIPYIKGDNEGVLLTALARSLGESPVFEYAYSGGDCALQVAIIADSDERVGFRYDRDPTTGERRSNIIGTENRRALAAEIKLVDESTQEVLAGPEVIRVTTDYDYFDGNSIRDLVVFSEGAPRTAMNFSLGQLDSFEGAHDDTNRPIYTMMAEKIVAFLQMHRLYEAPSNS